MIKFLDLYKLDKKLSKKINSNINQTIKNGDFILGKKVHEFEKKFSFYVNSKHTVGCANGTDALFLALKCLKLPKNSEVIVPAMTWISTVLAIILNNLKPVLVDINDNDPLININQIKKKNKFKNKSYFTSTSLR